MNPLMPAVGTLVVCFGIAVIVFRKRVVKSIERKAKKIGSPMISKSTKSDGTGRLSLILRNLSRRTRLGRSSVLSCVSERKNRLRDRVSL